MVKNIITKQDIFNLAKRHGLQRPRSISFHPVTIRVRYKGECADDVKMLHAAGVAADMWDNEKIQIRTGGSESNVPAFGHLAAVELGFTTAIWPRRPLLVGRQNNA